MTVLLVGRGLLGARVRAAPAWRPAPTCASVVGAMVRPRRSARGAARRRRLRLRRDGAWDLAWCAGAGVVATTAEDLAAEVELVAPFRGGARPSPRAACSWRPPRAACTPARRRPALHEDHDAAPGLAVRATRSSRWSTPWRRLASAAPGWLVGRIANLYGPGQDLTKPQGLISQLCLAA